VEGRLPGDVLLPEVFGLPRNAVGFLLKKLCIDRLIPRMQAIAHLFDSLRHLGGKVIGLADIGCQVVKVNATVFVAFHQLEVTLSNSAAGNAALIAVVRVVPKQRFAIQSFALECRPDVDAVDVMVDRDSCGRSDCRKQVN